MLLVVMLAYVPAMVSPVMMTRSFAGPTSDTIMSGVLSLIDQGSVGIAVIIFAASICIPAIKFVVIAGLASSLQFGWVMSEHTRHKLHRVTELIGRWSMIDVFVIAILTALIQLGSFMTVIPGPGIDAFALSVVFTMLAASSLDPRLFWDNSVDARRSSS
jgi:paraquat-inducible protein A